MNWQWLGSGLIFVGLVLYLWNQKPSPGPVLLEKGPSQTKSSVAKALSTFKPTGERTKEILTLDEQLDVLNEIMRRNSPESRDWANLSYEDFNAELATWITEVERELGDAGIDPLPLALQVYKSDNPYVRLMAIRWYYQEVAGMNAKRFTQFMEFTKDPLLSVESAHSLNTSAEAKLAQVMTDWLVNLGGWPSQEVSGYEKVMSTTTGGRRILRQMGVAPVKP